MNTAILLERLEALSNEKGVALTTAFVESKVGKNFKSNLRYANPSMGKITMLANYFDVTVDYLLGDTDQKEKPGKDNTLTELSDAEKRLFDAFSQLDESNRLALLSVAEAMSQQQKQDTRSAPPKNSE